MSRESKKKELIAIRGHKCESCTLVEWLGDWIPLEIHHEKPPSEADEDLKLLCPNCHACTDNYRGKGIPNVSKVSDEKLLLACTTASNLRQLLLDLGLAPKGGNYKSILNRLEKLGEADKFRKVKLDRECLQCGIEIYKGKFCTTTCSNRFNRSRNRETKIVWPSKEVILQMIESSNYLTVGKALGVSDNAVRAFLRRTE